MTKFNKSLLTAAVVGALALPGLASAATLNYSTNQQIVYAKDLFVNNTISIDTPTNLRLTAQAVDDNSGRISAINGDVLTAKVTLTNGAQFDSTALAETLVQTFTEGTQTGGAGGLINFVPGSANYNGSELNFQYTASGVGNVGGDYVLELNSAKVKNLIEGLFTGSQISAEITVQNQAGQQILAARRVIARSAWGVTVEELDVGQTDRYIDVGADPRKTLFGDLTVGSSAAQFPGTAEWFRAGGVNIDITEALEAGPAPATTYINNFSAVALSPEYNIVNTASFWLAVSGTDLSAFEGGNAWVSTDFNCATGAGISQAAQPALNAEGKLVFALPTTSDIFIPVTSAPPTGAGVNLYVCLGADNEAELVPQALSAELTLDYDLPTQRVNPQPWAFGLAPLQLNGTTLLFQNVNPAANGQAQSFLRLTNNNAVDCPINIDAKDDAGLHTGNVELTLAPHASIHINSDDLENGNAGKGLTGSWGDGTGRWYVRVTAECSNVAGSALNRNTSTGVVTDLTPAKAETWLTPTDKL